MQLRFASRDEWLARATYQFPCDIPAFSVRDGSGRTIDLKPFAALCHDVMIIGGDWVPAYSDGLALLEQMVHVPDRYLHKSSNIKPVDGGYALVRPIERIDDDVVLIGGQDSYYHWLLDFLPRAIFAKNALGTRKLVINENPARYILESLAALGIGPDRLLPLAADRVILPRSVVVPSLLVSNTATHKAVPGLLREAFPQTTRTECKRVYVSRSDTARRGLSNEPDVTALLARYGFETFVTGRMSFEEQRNLFYGAEAVVAVNGAAMANIVFCPAGTDIFDICWMEWKPTFIQVLARFCLQRHQYVPAHVVAVGSDGNPSHGTWEVDLDALAAALHARFGGDAA